MQSVINQVPRYNPQRNTSHDTVIPSLSGASKNTPTRHSNDISAGFRDGLKFDHQMAGRLQNSENLANLPPLSPFSTSHENRGHFSTNSYEDNAVANNRRSNDRPNTGFDLQRSPKPSNTSKEEQPQGGDDEWMAGALPRHSSAGLSPAAGRLVDSTFDGLGDNEGSHTTQDASSRNLWHHLLQTRNESPGNQFTNQRQELHAAMPRDRGWLAVSPSVLHDIWRSTQIGKSKYGRGKGLYLMRTSNRPKIYLPRKTHIATKTRNRPWWDGGQVTTYSTYLGDWKKVGRPRYFRRKGWPWMSGKVYARGPIFDPNCVH